MPRPSPRTDQIAQYADVLDPAALDRASLLSGTTLDGRLIMSRSDWNVAVNGGLVRVLEGVPLSSAPL